MRCVITACPREIVRLSESPKSSEPAEQETDLLKQINKSLKEPTDTKDQLQCFNHKAASLEKLIAVGQSATQI
jgi:hypothetical protein